MRRNCLMNIANVSPQRIQIWRSLSAVVTSVVQSFRFVILHMLVERLLIANEMPTNVALEPVLRTTRVNLHVLLERVLQAKSLRADLANFLVEIFVRVFNVMLQSNGIDVDFSAANIVTCESGLDVIIDVNCLHVIFDHELLGKALSALVAILQINFN